MEKSAKIFELNSDLLERNFTFWNKFYITLYEDKLFVKKSILFGKDFEEKTFDIEHIDSLFVTKSFNIPIAILGLMIMFALIATEIPFLPIIGFGICIWAFIGHKKIVISSSNDKVSIKFTAVPKKKLNELISKTLELKKNYKSTAQTNISLNNPKVHQADFSEKLNKLKKLLDDGIINETEYKEKKKDVLKNI